MGGGSKSSNVKHNRKAGRRGRDVYKHQYSKSAVDAAIKRDKRIKGREAKLIHALLKGRQKEDEPQ